MPIIGKKTLGRRFRKLSKVLTRGELLHSFMQGGFVFERGAKKRIRSQGLIDTGNLRDSTIAEPDVSVTKGVAVVIGPRGVIYAAIHEFGGVLHPRVTRKMRGFAWHKFKETGEPMWRAIALTRKARLTIKIPARPYMRPTFDEDKDRAVRAINKSIAEKIARRVIRG